MTNTGFTLERAEPHEAAVAAVVNELRCRGYPCQELPVEGHRPDIRLDDGDYVEVKTGLPNLAIEMNSLHEYRRIEVREGRRVYIVHAPDPDTARWRVLTPDSVQIKGGPRRRSGTGSNDDWYLCNGRGTPFDAFFTEVPTTN